MFERIGIIAGAMGRGIAQLFASAGKQVWLYDARGESVAEALRFNRELLRSLAKGRLSRGARRNPGADAAGVDVAGAGRLRPADRGHRRESRGQTGTVRRAGGAGCRGRGTGDQYLVTVGHADRRGLPPAAGGRFSFLQPVPLMKLVEVVRGERSDPQVIERLVKLAEEAGHFLRSHRILPVFWSTMPVAPTAPRRSASSPRASLMPSRSTASCATAGFRMGPFELFDLTGLDVSHAVMESVYQQFYQDPRYTPSYQAAQRVAAGLLGRKSGQGYYRYDNGQQKSAGAGRRASPGGPPILAGQPGRRAARLAGSLAGPDGCAAGVGRRRRNGPSA